jgi:cyclopropane fatty-acyl-phospholipid synthase-like methyltransferase
MLNLIDFFNKEKRAERVSKEFWKNCKNNFVAHPDLYDRQEQVIGEIFVPLLQPMDVVLDLGCAEGRYALQIAPHCGQVVAYDISAHLIEQAQEKATERRITNASFIVQDLTSPDLDRQYDHIMCMGFFTTIPNQAQFQAIIDNIRQHLKKGGYLLLKDSVTEGSQELFIHKNYAAIYRNESEYLEAFTSHGFILKDKHFLISREDKLVHAKLFLMQLA